MFTLPPYLVLLLPPPPHPYPLSPAPSLSLRLSEGALINTLLTPLPPYLVPPLSPMSQAIRRSCVWSTSCAAATASRYATRHRATSPSPCIWRPSQSYRPSSSSYQVTTQHTTHTTHHTPHTIVHNTPFISSSPVLPLLRQQTATYGMTPSSTPLSIALPCPSFISHLRHDPH